MVPALVAFTESSLEAPQESYVGIGLAILSLIVMPLLASAKRKVATSLRSEAMHADSRQTDICAYLIGDSACWAWVQKRIR